MESTPTAAPPSKVFPWGARQESLLERARHDGDERALAELVEQMMPLARRLARKYRSRGEPLDDLIQVASLALLKALQRFDPDRGVDFPAFAVPTILGEIKRHYRDFGWSVHVPRSIQDRALKVNRELQKLTPELGRSPTPAELAARCGLSVEEALESRLVIDAYAPLSLDMPVSEGADEPAPLAAGEDPGYRRVEDHSALGSALRVLPQRERRIVAMRYGEELSQQQIAERIGISQMHVSRLLRRALERLSLVLVH